MAMTEAELVEAIYQVDTALSANIEFWLTGTFAVVVTSFFAADRLSPRVRLLLAILYIVFSMTFFTRYMVNARIGGAYIDEIRRYNPEPWAQGGQNIIYLGTILIFVVGTISALYFLFYAEKLARKKEEPSNAITEKIVVGFVTMFLILVLVLHWIGLIYSVQ